MGSTRREESEDENENENEDDKADSGRGGGFRRLGAGRWGASFLRFRHHNAKQAGGIALPAQDSGIHRLLFWSSFALFCNPETFYELCRGIPLLRNRLVGARLLCSSNALSATNGRPRT